MDLEFSFLHQIFDPFPEPVFLLQNTKLVYANPAWEDIASDYDHPESLFLTYCEDLPEKSFDLHCALKEGLFHVTVSVLNFGKLVTLRPLNKPQVPCNQTFVPSQLRDHLSNVTATIEQITQKLNREKKLEDYRDLLSIQLQSMYRLLRLTRQIELSTDDWEQDFPFSALDLAAVCEKLSSELTSRLSKSTPRFTYQSDLPCLILSGNRCLLEELILVLLSNAAKIAGQHGSIHLNLTQKQNRAIISISHDGNSLPEEELLTLFTHNTSSKLPLPKEGSNLDLWLAYRIAMFHKGVIMGANRPQGGTEFVVSFPIVPPEQLQFQSDDCMFHGDGFSSVLVGLADVLPREAFFDADLEL